MRISPAHVRSMFSTDSPKAVKAQGFGYLNAILYMAPHTFGGVGNLCPKASEGCKALCLGLYSGQAAMIKAGERLNSVRAARVRKAQAFMRDRGDFMRDVALSIAFNVGKAQRYGLNIAVRLNGSTDIAFEGIPVTLDVHDCEKIRKLSRGQLAVTARTHRNIFELFATVQFLDYTKLEARTRRALPSNYHLTFSRSESNAGDVARVMQTQINVAVVFANGLPATWQGRAVIDGDSHDLRFLDSPGVVVGLTPKGHKARRDQSGFVIRESAHV